MAATRERVGDGTVARGPEVSGRPALVARLGGAPLDAVKASAAVLMVVDHVNTILFNGAYVMMWRLGRIAFPLFCFALACNLLRGAEPSKYVTTLLLAGIATQPIYSAAFNYGTHEASILVTLGVGVTLAAALLRAPALAGHAALALGLVVAFAIPQWAKTGVDFGLAGILLPSALVLALHRPLAFAPWLVPVLLAVNYASWHPPGETWLGATGRDALFIAFGGSAIIGLAVLLLRGRARFLPRYALHLFYPGHLLALAVLRALGVGA